MFLTRPKSGYNFHCNEVETQLAKHILYQTLKAYYRVTSNPVHALYTTSTCSNVLLHIIYSDYNYAGLVTLLTIQTERYTNGFIFKS